LSIEHLSDVWRKIANEFKDDDNIYGYGLMNEPYDMLPLTPWAKIAQATINEIRKVDKKLPFLWEATVGVRLNVGWNSTII